MFRCNECEKEFETYSALNGHKSKHTKDNPSRKSHKEINQQKKEDALKGIASYKCSYCDEGFLNSKKLAGHVSSCSKHPNIESILKNRISKITNFNKKGLTLERKSKISEGMKKAHKEGRAWNIGKSRWNNEKSYPEKFFTKVIENEFEDKDFVCEYPMSIYSLDFAWVHLQKCIEIDGDQHLKIEYKERDNRKDEYLKSQNWQVLRIFWKDFWNETKKYIQIAKDFIHSDNPIVLEPSKYLENKNKAEGLKELKKF